VLLLQLEHCSPAQPATLALAFGLGARGVAHALRRTGTFGRTTTSAGNRLRGSAGGKSSVSIALVSHSTLLTRLVCGCQTIHCARAV
jgi:hypothetical protein